MEKCESSRSKKVDVSYRASNLPENFGKIGNQKAQSLVGF